jgi:hypothetical protein
MAWDNDNTLLLLTLCMDSVATALLCPQAIKGRGARTLQQPPVSHCIRWNPTFWGFLHIPSGWYISEMRHGIAHEFLYGSV